MVISIDFVRLKRNIADLLIKRLMHKLVTTMDTHLHMNGDPMEWSSMGNNKVFVD